MEAYQVQDDLLSVKDALGIKMPLEAIHLGSGGRRDLSMETTADLIGCRANSKSSRDCWFY